ncbi:unnamed protein product [Blepharisma stoltei]|uniref:Ribosomal protein L17 n=1 Tax=Blepharisma stoltei TaxID=1481888 RepID=A0AAU9IUK7_9CILI|nr:unnamed protein product [Blepharisma stoltei]
MRHGKVLLKLSRKSKPRNKLLRNLLTSLIEHERIVTTQAKAKAISGLADKIITFGKKTNITDERKRILLRAYLYTDRAVEKVMSELVPRFQNRTHNYTMRSFEERRKGDGAVMHTIQYFGNKYLEEERENRYVNAMPDFSLGILNEELGFFQSALSDLTKKEEKINLADASKEMEGKPVLGTKEVEDKIKFFEKQIDRVKREIEKWQLKRDPNEEPPGMEEEPKKEGEKLEGAEADKSSKKWLK